ncbi:hypothetical protein GmHk_03G006242 [Glycine max]|nr:hypothetical protein GmHk_03G006242 [Glycine max]KAH1255974.1 hypothetical protein GmHk_03G006242 [Glycine max]
MASTEGLVPITRAFLASYYDKHPFTPLSAHVSTLSSQIRSMANDFLTQHPPIQGERILINEADQQPPHKMDENMWKNREYIEETIFLLQSSNWPEALKQQSAADCVEFSITLGKLKDKLHNTLKALESFQTKNAEHVFNTEVDGIQDEAFEELWKLKVPAKYAVFAWRLLRNRKIIPIWWESLSWVNISTAFSNDPKQHFLQHGLIMAGGIRTTRWKCWWLAVTWSIWQKRNKIIFSNDSFDTNKVIDDAAFLLWTWLSNLEKDFSLHFNQWSIMTYLPQDFRGTLIRQQRERSERNKQAEVDTLVNSGGSIHDRYALLWKQQMDRRRQLAQLGSATGVYKTLVKYLVGVPQVLLDFTRQINDDDGPMEEQRHRYGPPLYSLTSMILSIRLFLSLSWARYDANKLKMEQIAVLEQAVDVYTMELERFLTFISEVFANAPFFISAEVAGALEARKNDDYKEINVPAGKTYEETFVSEIAGALLYCIFDIGSNINLRDASHLFDLHTVLLSVDAVNSYIAWDFSLVQGTINMDIGFSLEFLSPTGEKTLMLPYRRYESDQGNFCTLMAGSYKLIWDNTYSTFFKKVLRYKIDCIPPVTDSVQSD